MERESAVYVEDLILSRRAPSGPKAKEPDSKEVHLLRVGTVLGTIRAPVPFDPRARRAVKDKGGNLLRDFP